MIGVSIDTDPEPMTPIDTVFPESDSMTWFGTRRKPSHLSYAGLGASPKEPLVKLKPRSEIGRSEGPDENQVVSNDLE